MAQECYAAMTCAWQQSSHRQAFAASAAAELLREAQAAQDAGDDAQAVSRVSICTARTMTVMTARSR